MSSDRTKELEQIFDNDPFGLLDVKPKKSAVQTSEERLIASFEEINTFIDANNRKPEANLENINEYQLHSRLKSMNQSPEKIDQLREYDRHQLLKVNTIVFEEGQSKHEHDKPIESIDDLMEIDDLGLLTEKDDIFDFKHVPKDYQRASAEFVAKRKPCPDFEKYKDLFKQVHYDLSVGDRKILKFRQGNLKEGNFYIHNGLLFLLEKVNIEIKEHYKPDGTRVREDGRTLCIFENGTQSNMLKRSVEKILYENGKVISTHRNEGKKQFERDMRGISDDDLETGYIYVLRSKSENPEIKNTRHLYKIGFSKNKTEKRIKDANKQPTYLMADVELVSEWQCYNMNPQKFEKLIHQVFGSSCLDITVTDNKGKNHSPREWFIVPLQVIEEAVEMISTGEIVGYVFNSFSQTLENKNCD